MSTKPAAIPLFADAYLADTMHLSTEEHGAYLLMLMAAWRFDDCSLPNDDRKLSRIVGLSPRRWGQMKDTIMDFWTVEGGRIFNARLRKERGYVLQKSESNRENARKRWSAQAVENKQSGKCDRISDGNAPPPPPIEEEPNGSPSTPLPPKPKAKSKSAGPLPAPPAWVPADAWAGFVAMRDRKGAKLTPYAQDLLLRKLERFRDEGQPPGAVLDQSTLKNWTDIYPLKDDQHGNASRIQTDGGSAAGDRGRIDRRDSFTRAIDRAGGFDRPVDDFGPSG